jgi:hypothetical protein
MADHATPRSPSLYLTRKVFLAAFLLGPPLATAAPHDLTNHIHGISTTATHTWDCHHQAPLNKPPKIKHVQKSTLSFQEAHHTWAFLNTHFFVRANRK